MLKQLSTYLQLLSEHPRFHDFIKHLENMLLEFLELVRDVQWIWKNQKWTIITRILTNNNFVYILLALLHNINTSKFVEVINNEMLTALMFCFIGFII